MTLYSLLQMVLETMVWDLYLPVRMDDLLGLHSACWTYALSSRRLLAAKESMLGVCMGGESNP